MHFYKFVSSMTTGLVLLALIGLASAVGSSLWPENFFQTWPFRLLLLFLFINMALCTINTSTRFFRHRAKISKNWKILFRSTGLLMLHAGIVLILIGAGLYSYLGHSVQLSILEGDTVEINKVIPVDNSFSLKLHTFSIEFNADGSPSQYYSEMEVLEAGKTALAKTVSVNHPLVYKGVKAYQSSYGYLTDVVVQDGDAAPKTVLAQDGDFIQFADTSRTVKVFKYIPHFDPEIGLETKSMEPVNPRVVYSVYEGTELLGVGAAPFGEPISIDENVSIEFKQVRPYTVLTVKTDPGLPLVTTGGLLLMLGVCMVLFGPSSRKKEVSSVHDN